jgi:hypothetical protein
MKQKKSLRVNFFFVRLQNFHRIFYTKEVHDNDMEIGKMKNTAKIIVSILVLTAFIGLTGNDALAWGVPFPGGAVWLGNGHGMVNFPGGGVSWGNGHGHVVFPGGGVGWGHHGGGVGFPGGGVRWGHHGGHGGVRLSIPGLGSYWGW